MHTLRSRISEMVLDTVVRLNPFFARFFERDEWLLFVLFVLAALTRLPIVFFPDSTIADEFVYSNYAMLLANGVPFFDIHPPLVRILFAWIISPFAYTPQLFAIDIGNAFGDFPFSWLRLFVASFGIALPLLFYLIGRLSGLGRHFAFLVGFLVVTDSALTLYGATILPDTILLFLNLSAIACILIAVRLPKNFYSWSFTLIGGVLWGLALATKWTALGVLPVFVILFFGMTKTRWHKFFSFLLMGASVYILVFCYYFTLFTQPVLKERGIVTFNIDLADVQQTTLPDPYDFGEIVRYLPTEHELMLSANIAPEVVDNLAPAPRPHTWPLGQSTFLYWWDKGDPTIVIYLIANLALWPSLFFLLLFAICDIGSALLRRPRETWSANKMPITLMVGYFANYLPFFFIARPTYLYHYFTSLAFLLLLAPHVIPRITQMLDRRQQNRTPVRVFFALLLVTIMVTYLITMPVIYGY